MAQDSVERRVWINSASGYVRSILRLSLGVISFRLLCTALSSEELGFYGLVWSLLGYGVLFDLGMGVAVQKSTAELLARKEWDELSRVLSSVFFCNCVCGIFVASAGWLASESLLRAVGVSPANYRECLSAVRIFFMGMGTMFPLEMFREVHYGQQRIAFAEQVTTASGVVSFVMLVFALDRNWGLSRIFIIQMACMVATGIVITISALRAMPSVRLRPSRVSWRVLRTIARFSALAFGATLMGIIVLQMDRLLIGAILSVSSVAFYHIGAKVSEIFTAFTKQLPEALAPAAASLHGVGDRLNWQRLFMRGIRLNALVTTPLFLLCALFMEGLLAIFTREQPNSETVFLGELLLVSSYSTMLTHGIARAIFMMSGQESRLVRLLFVEAMANLGASFILLQWLRSPIGAAIGSLLPAVVIGWGFLWPWAAREIGVSPATLARKTLVPVFFTTGPVLIFGLACRTIPVLDFRSSTAMLFADAAVAAAIATIGTYYMALTAEERLLVGRKVANAFGRVNIGRQCGRDVPSNLR